MNKYETGYEEIEFAEKEQEYFSPRNEDMRQEMIRLETIQVPPKRRIFKIGTSSTHERNKDILDRELDNYLLCNPLE